MIKSPVTLVNLVDYAWERTREAVFPIHQSVYHFLMNVDVGVVVSIPTSLVQEQNLRIFVDQEIVRGPMHGLRLNIRPLADSDSAKSWIKRVYICSRISQAGGSETVAGYKREPGHEDDIFRAVTQFCLRSDHSPSVLFWAVGPRSHAALSAGLEAESRFNPSDWDADGYYQDTASSNLQPNGD